MSWTVLQLAEVCCEEAGRDWSDDRSLTEVERYVNDVWKQIAIETDWPWLYTTESISLVASTQEYSLQSSAVEPIGVRLTTEDRELVHTPVEQMMATDIELSGIPTRWWISGYDSSTSKTKIKVWPIPATTYTMEVHEIIRPTDLAADTVIPVPEEFIPIMKNGVRAIVALDIGDANAQMYLGLYTDALRKARSRYATARGATHDQLFSDIPKRRGSRSRLPGNYPEWGA